MLNITSPMPEHGKICFVAFLCREFSFGRRMEWSQDEDNVDNDNDDEEEFNEHNKIT